ncbi:hypothetical protein Tco_0242087 [Tanacetum coccineum]
MPKFTIKSTNKAALKEFDQKSALYQTMHANKSFNKNLANHRLYHALMEALIEDKNAMDKGVADTVKDHKRKHDDDEDPLAGPNQGKKTKRRRTKELESFKKPSTTKEIPKGKALSKGSKTGKSASSKKLVEEPTAEVVMDDAGKDVNDLEYLKSFDPKRTYTTSITKTKVSKYEIEGIEYMVLTLWSPTKSVSVKKLHRYGHLEEIVAKRADCQFYKFKEGDIMDLHLNDIEDMLLLTIQHKLFHLTDSNIVDFIVALYMFTRSLVIRNRVENLQLGVES